MKTYVYQTNNIRNSYAPEEAKLIESGALTKNRTVTTAANIATIMLKSIKLSHNI